MKKHNNLGNKETDVYYKAYEERYRQVYEKDYLWSTKEPTPEIFETIKKEHISKSDQILEIGCGEGRDAIFLLNKKYDVLALDYSKTVIEKCKNIFGEKFSHHFKQFDIITDTLDKKYDFIYSVAVIHMFIDSKHRNKFYKFVYEHLKENGIAFIVSMGDGKKNYSSDPNVAYNDVERTVMNNGERINVVATSCRMVDWDTFEKELNTNKLIIKKKWVSNDIPEFNTAMCVIVSRK